MKRLEWGMGWWETVVGMVLMVKIGKVSTKFDFDWSLAWDIDGVIRSSR